MIRCKIGTSARGASAPIDIEVDGGHVKESRSYGGIFCLALLFLNLDIIAHDTEEVLTSARIQLSYNDLDRAVLNLLYKSPKLRNRRNTGDPALSICRYISHHLPVLDDCLRILDYVLYIRNQGKASFLLIPWPRHAALAHQMCESYVRECYVFSAKRLAAD